MRNLVLAVAILMGTGSGYLAGQSKNVGVDERYALRDCAHKIDQWTQMPGLKNSPGLMEDLADCYVQVKDPVSAEKWYAKALASGNSHPHCRRKYAEALKANGKYEEAMQQMRTFAEQASQPHDIADFIATCRTLQANTTKQGKFEIDPVSLLNSSRAEVAACRNDQEFFFYSRVPKGKLGNQRYAGAKKRPFTLYAAVDGQFGEKDKIRIVSKKAGQRERSIGIVHDVQKNGFYQTKAIKIGQGRTQPAIYHSWWDRNGFGNEDRLPVNGPGSPSNFHPCLDPKGSILVFASDREGGYGGSDIYWCQRQKNGWSSPRNMGPNINTTHDESYPSFSAAGVLYFASNGHLGFGGIDVFYSEFELGEWGPAINVGASVNSFADDFALVWSDPNLGSSGYFSSTRNAASGADLFAFVRHPEVVGQVVDAITKEPVPYPEVFLTPLGAEQTKLASTIRGEYYGYISPNVKYRIEAKAEGYEPQTWYFDAAELQQGLDLDLDLSLEPMRGYELKLKLVDDETGLPLEGALVRTLNAANGEELRPQAAIPAEVRWSMELGTDYAIMIQKPGYKSAAIALQLSSFRRRKVDERVIRMMKGEQILLVGQVVGANGASLPGQSRIDVMNMKTKAVMHTIESDSAGNFSLWIDRALVGEYSLFASHEGEATTHVKVIANDDQYFPIALEPVQFSMEFASQALYYDFGKRDVRDLSKQALDDIYFFLLRNPDVHMELRTYSDSRGDAKANEELARQRSAAIITQLILRGGIAPERLRHVDFGETKLVNDCVDGVPCTEEQHAQNRRTEVYFHRVSNLGQAAEGR